MPSVACVKHQIVLSYYMTGCVCPPLSLSVCLVLVCVENFCTPLSTLAVSVSPAKFVLEKFFSEKKLSQFLGKKITPLSGGYLVLLYAFTFAVWFFFRVIIHAVIAPNSFKPCSSSCPIGLCLVVPL